MGHRKIDLLGYEVTKGGTLHRVWKSFKALDFSKHIIASHCKRSLLSNIFTFFFPQHLTGTTRA
jgi:hypothetical protein